MSGLRIQKRLIFLAGTTAFSAAIVLLLIIQRKSSAAHPVKAVLAEHTLNLPLLTRYHSAGPSSPFGVQMYGRVDHSTGLDEVVAAGARWVRVPISWASAEPKDVEPHQYRWSAVDSKVAAINGVNIVPLLTLVGNPEWAAEYPMGPVNDIAELQEFVAALVERYDGDGKDDAPGSPVVRYWEIYNEPDNSDEWIASHGGVGFFGDRGMEYAALLDAIYPAMKAASPRAQVVFGGIAHDNFVSEGGRFDPDFVDDVLSACTGACFDVMNFHYFPFFRHRWERYGRDLTGKANYLRSKMALHGFDRPMMCTETTWPQAGVWGGTELQSRYVLAANVRGLASGLVLLNWYAWRDVDSTMPGILTIDLEPKPAYLVYQTLAQQLDRAEFVRALTGTETGHRDLEGYVLSVPDIGHYERRDVVWLDCPAFRLAPPQDCPGDSRTMHLQASALRVIDMFGTSVVVRDADDGLVDGKIALEISADPIYIDYTT